jgi:outer membrane immunogenic protein
MRIWTTGAIVLWLTVDAAQAADPEAASVTLRRPQEFNWSGLYFGGSAGYGWLEDADHAFSPPLRDEGEDWIVGAHAGYMHQIGNFVAGVEAEAIRLDITYEGFDFITVDRTYLFKARGGVAIDRLLLSGHFGGVYADTNFMDLADWGKVAGAGIDFAFTDYFLTGISYDHMWFEEFDGTEIDADLDILRFRLSYKF